MNRRDFVLRSSLALSAGLASRSLLEAQAPAGPAAAAPQPLTVAFTPLRRGVGYFTARGGSIGWLVNDAAVAAVDTQFPDTAARFTAELPGRKDRPFDVVINTHHHGDHTGGNPVFRKVAKSIVAHANVPTLIEARAKQDKRALNPEVLPTQTFTDTWRMELGDEVVSTRYFGPAHTKGDIVTMFEKANVVHMGDLLFNRIYPVIDRSAGASLRGWIGVLEAVTKTYPRDAIFIFGHAGAKFDVTGSSKDLLVFRDFLSAVLAYTEKQIAAGRTKPEIIALENFPGFPDFHQPLPNRLGGLLGATYDELTTRAG